MAFDEARQEEIRVRMEIAQRKADLGDNIDSDLHEIMRAAGVDTSKNANPFVPWDDPNIPFECDCGEIIYADSEHEH